MSEQVIIEHIEDNPEDPYTRIAELEAELVSVREINCGGGKIIDTLRDQIAAVCEAAEVCFGNKSYEEKAEYLERNGWESDPLDVKPEYKWKSSKLSSYHNQVTVTHEALKIELKLALAATREVGQGEGEE